MFAGGILGVIAILSIDLLDAGREGGIGPAQRVGLGLMIVIDIGWLDFHSRLGMTPHDEPTDAHCISAIGC